MEASFTNFELIWFHLHLSFKSKGEEVTNFAACFTIVIAFPVSIDNISAINTYNHNSHLGKLWAKNKL